MSDLHFYWHCLVGIVVSTFVLGAIAALVTIGCMLLWRLARRLGTSKKVVDRRSTVNSD